ncbi:MAG: 23S rRNA (uracil(1939)-C(5))-methyltransferase RlmD [Gammaproteobacteria bacterium]|nr:23S rRNA (uracil(1939)-C(5))-methyltransferase RlmD [Gammaproteobacteria bacterium]
MPQKRRDPETGCIDSVAHDGRGIISDVGKKVFVAGALAGEQVRYMRRKRRRNYDEAELLEVLESSPNRVAAKCAVFGRCGGCAMQHIRIAEQRDIKSQTLKDNLERIGKVLPRNWLPPLIGDEWNYRRRARLAVKDVPRKGRVLVGFRERHAPFITDMQRCEILAAPVDDLIMPLSELIGDLSIRARLPQIEVAVADNAAALVFRVLDPPSNRDLDKLRLFGKAHDLRIWLQPGGLDSLELAWPDKETEPLTYSLPEFDVQIEFAPTDFVQVNGEVNRRMVHAALAYLQPGPDDRVLDFYCGIGNFSLPLARQTAAVLGIEGDPILVERARANAGRNGLSNAEFRCADLSAIDGAEAWLTSGWDRVLLDPARTGAAEVLQHMRTLDPARIVYVSCHPGTLARDAGTLVNELGYTLDAAGIIDMFPHTAHVESVAVFAK